MYKPNDSRPGHGTRRGICVVAITGIAFVDHGDPAVKRSIQAIGSVKKD